MKPLFSIIVATFNSASTIRNLLDTLVEQTNKDFELVIVDNLSSDDTLDIVKSYNIENIKIISEQDKGIYDAINKGIRASCGQWIYNIGSDDSFCNKNVLSTAKQYLDSTTKSFIYGSVKFKGVGVGFVDGMIYDGKFYISKLLTRGISQQATFYRKELFEKIGYFNIRYKVCADHEFALRAFEAKEDYYIPLTIANFSYGGLSTQEKDLLFIEDKVTDKFK